MPKAKIHYDRRRFLSTVHIVTWNSFTAHLVILGQIYLFSNLKLRSFTWKLCKPIISFALHFQLRVLRTINRQRKISWPLYNLMKPTMEEISKHFMHFSSTAVHLQRESGPGSRFQVRSESAKLKADPQYCKQHAVPVPSFNIHTRLYK
jgi:hypothetical protein